MKHDDMMHDLKANKFLSEYVARVSAVPHPSLGKGSAIPVVICAEIPDVDRRATIS
jgi:hypothetical protein